MLKHVCKFAILFLPLAFPAMLRAGIASQCKYPDFLSSGFNINNYNQCYKLISQCPSNGLLRDKTCVDKIVSTIPVCQQFGKLAQERKIPANQISAKQMGNFTIINVTFPADGQNSYYIISPNGCFINTNIDPRKLDKSLNENYQKTNFMIVNWGEPSYQRNTDGTQTIRVTLKITDTCIACPLIGYAVINFDFDDYGKLLNQNLVSFNRELQQKT